MLIRLMIIVAFIVVGLAAFSQLNPSAKQSLKPLDNGLSAMRSWFETAFSSKPATGEETHTSGTKVYKWQDKDGNWQFSNQPPAGITSSVTVYRSDTNIIQAQKPEPPATAETPPTSTALPATPDPLMPITDPQRVKQLMDDARNVQNLVDERQQTIDQAIPGR